MNRHLKEIAEEERDLARQDVHSSAVRQLIELEEREEALRRAGRRAAAYASAAEALRVAVQTTLRVYGEGSMARRPKSADSRPPRRVSGSSRRQSKPASAGHEAWGEARHAAAEVAEPRHPRPCQAGRQGAVAPS